jgi:UPF0755 protein
MSSGGGWPPSDADGYFDEPGYEWSESSARSQGHGDPRARGRTDPYGHQGGYRQEPYNDAYGQGWQFDGRYADDQRGRDGYDQGDYGQGSYGQTGFDSYGEPGYGRYGYGHDLGSDPYAGGSYGRDGYGQDRYAQDGYGQAGYAGEYYGQSAPRRALPAPEGFGGEEFHQDGVSGDPHGRDRYGQEGFGSTAPYQAPSGYQPPDSYGPDNGYLAPSSPVRPALGPGSDQDVTASHRPDTGSFDSPDARDKRGSADGWFGQPSDTGSFGRDAEHAAGYDQWHDAADDADRWDNDEADEHDGDWEEDADAGLLSRRFGSGDSDDRGSDGRGSDGRGSDGRGSGSGSGRRAARAKRPKRLRGKFATTAAILAGALVLGAAADFGYERFQTWHTSRYGDYQGAGTGQVRFTVQPGAVLSTLGPALLKAQVIKELRPFDSAAAAAANASHLQPGVYLLHRHMSSALAVQYLLSPGHRVKDAVTIVEGTRASAIAQALAKQSGIPVSQFTQIIDHPPASLGLPSWARGKTAEGFLFPDTYTLLPKMTALQILQMMVTEFKQKVGAINLAGASQHVFTTPWHALIVASLIQAEAGNVSDFGKISRVVWNRLRDSMPLEFDSTVFYAMGKYGTAVNSKQRNFPSPYNTYLHTGLPPGPIGNPGVAAMTAAVHATHGSWLYFITDTRHKPYKTYFTSSLSQLQAWQRQFQN